MLYSRKLLKIHFKIQHITKMGEPRVLYMVGSQINATERVPRGTEGNQEVTEVHNL